MKYTVTTAIAALMLTAPYAMAEDIDTEIAIERQVVPEHRSATRLNLLPELQLPAVKQVRLNPSDRISAITIPGYMTTLDPASYATAADPYPWRGYAAIGYFPAFNLGASAGYRILDRTATTLDAWLQYNGASWHGDSPDFTPAGRPEDAGRMNLHRHSATIGASLNHKVGSRSAFTTDLQYTYGAWNMLSVWPGSTSITNMDMADAALNRIGLDFGWQSRTSDRFAYHASLGYGLMAYNLHKVLDPESSSPIENSGYIDAGFDHSVGNNAVWGIDLDAGVHAYNYPQQAFVKGRVGFCPRIRWSLKHFSASLGLKLDILFDGGMPIPDHNSQVDVQLFPQLDIAWTPSGSFTLWGKVKSFSTSNNFSELYDWNYMTMPGFDQLFSKVFDVQGGITLGPWRGASLELYAGYAGTDLWLMPFTGYGEIWQGTMAYTDLEGAHYGATFSYKYRSLLTVRGSVEGASHSDNDYTSGWYLWRDRAHWMMDASIDINPIKPLTITVGHNWRTGRRCYNADINGSGLIPLGNATSLRLAAAYRITPALSVFARGENILNHRHYIMPGIPAQGVAGLVGITYKLP